MYPRFLQLLHSRLSLNPVPLQFEHFYPFFKYPRLQLLQIERLLYCIESNEKHLGQFISL
jgi:hypothetical protein